MTPLEKHQRSLLEASGHRLVRRVVDEGGELAGALLDVLYPGEYTLEEWYQVIEELLKEDRTIGDMLGNN